MFTPSKRYNHLKQHYEKSNQNWKRPLPNGNQRPNVHNQQRRQHESRMVDFKRANNCIARGKANSTAKCFWTTTTRRYCLPTLAVSVTYNQSKQRLWKDISNVVLKNYPPIVLTILIMMIRRIAHCSVIEYLRRPTDSVSINTTIANDARIASQQHWH